MNEAFYLVNMPGYGYAKANELIKAQWGKMIERYLSSSRQLRAVFLLIDIRHEPSANDRQMYQWICHQGYHPSLLPRKWINRTEAGSGRTRLNGAGLETEKGTVIIPFSAQTKQGREEIYDVIDSLLAGEE